MGLAQGYTDVIAWHGRAPEDYCNHFGVATEDIPPELLLLWEADLHIGPDGKYMETDDRIKDIFKRHRLLAKKGTKNMHKEYGKAAVKINELLKKKGRLSDDITHR